MNWMKEKENAHNQPSGNGGQDVQWGVSLHCIKWSMLHGEEQLRGDPLDPKNPFGFSQVVMNLPGSIDYKPSKPWVYKFSESTGRIANDFFIYVDDVQVTGPFKEIMWNCTREVATHFNYLGVQDAPRKRREPKLEPGPWAGSMAITSNGKVQVMVSMDRWMIVKAMIKWIGDNALEVNNTMIM